MTLVIVLSCCEFSGNRYIILQLGKQEKIKGKVLPLAVVMNGCVVAITTKLPKEEEFKNVLAEAIRLTEDQSVVVAPV